MDAGIIRDYLKSQGHNCDVRYFNDGTIELLWAPETSEETKKAARTLIDAGVPEPPNYKEFIEKVFSTLSPLDRLQWAPVLSMSDEMIILYWEALTANPPKWFDHAYSVAKEFGIEK